MSQYVPHCPSFFLFLFPDDLNRVQVDLKGWIPVLNKFDDVFSDSILKYGNYIQVCDHHVGEKGDIEILLANESITRIQSLLDFSANLLKNTYNKEIYNSAEVCLNYFVTNDISNYINFLIPAYSSFLKSI